MQSATERKSFPFYLKEIVNRTVTGISAVTGNIDSGGDRIIKGAFKKTISEGMKRIRHLWQHDMRKPPIAVIDSLEEITKGKLPKEIRADFPEATGGLQVERTYLDTERGNEILQGIATGALNEMSFAYDALKYDFETIEEGDLKGLLIRNLRELRLWETSDVNWGMNEATLASKMSVPFRDTGKADISMVWPEPRLADFTPGEFAELPVSEKRRIEAHYAFSLNISPQVMGGFMLPHHKAEEKGVGVAVWTGVEKAMSALLGDISIPPGDRRSVYNHLKRHYEQFGKEAPDYKIIELAFTVRDALEVAEGNPDLEVLFSRLSEVSELLRAEPPKALTLNMVSRLALAKRKLSMLEAN